jgi:hypothetical protein
VASLLIALGSADAGAALERVLVAAGSQTAPAQADAGALLDAQLRAAAPLDAYTWSAFPGGVAIRLQPGTDGGLEPGLPRALSAATSGLVLTMEAVRTRDRYAIGSFLSGRTVQLDRCVEGVASGRTARELCDEDAVSEAFMAWLHPLFGPDVAPPHRLGAEPTGALLATPVTWDEASAETPLARIALRDPGTGLRVVERAGTLDPSDVARLSAGSPAAGVGLQGDGAPTRWAVLRDDGSLDEGLAADQAALSAALPAWALAAAP